jgi:uncharacterized protein (TIGR02453 family)
MSDSSTFSGFPKEGIQFLKALIENNSKEWLEAHKAEYERFILSPNKAYVEEMGEHLQILIPTIHAIPKINKSLFRIYRDARFHLDDPIKERIGIIMWQGPGHRMQSSSFYMHYDPYEVLVAVGIRNFKPPLLQAYRNYIKNDAKRESLHHILEELKAKGYTVPEPEYKRLPAEFESEPSFGYLTRYRSMVAYRSFKPDRTFHSARIIERNFKVYEDLLPLQQWVYELTLYASKA